MIKKLPKYSVIHEYAEASRKRGCGDQKPRGISEGAQAGALGEITIADKPEKRRFYIADTVGLTSQIAVGMILCVIIGVAGGRALDSRLNTSPLMLIIGILLGAFASYKVLYDIAIKKWMG